MGCYFFQSSVPSLCQHITYPRYHLVVQDDDLLLIALSHTSRRATGLVLSLDMSGTVTVGCGFLFDGILILILLLCTVSSIYLPKHGTDLVGLQQTEKSLPPEACQPQFMSPVSSENHDDLLGGEPVVLCASRGYTRT